MSTTERRDKVDELLDQMKMSHRKKHYPQQLSGGQQQRVAVARAISNNPRVILADEPTGNLDTKHGDDVMKLLMELNEAGTTVVMVTHSPHYAEFCRRTIKLLDGKIVTESVKDEFYV
jgi:putative ABC transport system ATP-binding protein